MTGPVIPELQRLLAQTAERQIAARAASGSGETAHLRWRGPFVGLVALLASASALAATHPWSPTLGSPRAGHPSTSASAVPSSERALLGVLRRPQTAVDRTPAVQATLRYLVAAEEHGVRVASVRSLGVSPAAPDRAIVVFALVRQGLADGTVPGGADDVCVVFPTVFATRTTSLIADGRKRVIRSGGGQGAGQGCGNARQLRRGAIGETAGSRHGFYTFGLVPDYVRSVQIHLPTGQTISAAVHANFYDAPVGALPPRGSAVTWVGANGRPAGPDPR